MAAAVAGNAMTKITLSFMLSLLSDNNFQGPDAPVNSKYHWAYKGPEGPDSWHVHYKDCAGERQSPINILHSVCEHDPTLEPITLGNFETTSGATGPCILNVTNNGHAASIRVHSDDMWIQGGGLGQKYKTVEFHFHWGSTDELGSEHSINGRKYPLEMHVVNFAEKYGTVKLAMTQPDGLAVLGVFFELSDHDNPHFAALDEALRHVHKAGEHTTVNQLILRTLLPEDLSRYWRYNGSLTTPFCFETVIWTVFAESQKISKSQLETLRSLLHEEGHDISDRGDHRSYTPSRLVDNWRPIQPLNGRIVKRSFPDVVGGSSMGNQLMDSKIVSFGATAPVLSNFNDGTSVIGTNFDGTLARPSFSPPYAIHRSLAAQPRQLANSQTIDRKDRLQPQMPAESILNAQQSSGSKPVTEKYLLYNSGSDASSGNTTYLGTIPENLSQIGSNVESLPVDGSAATLFGQIQQSNSASSSPGDADSMNIQRNNHFRRAPNSIASKPSDRPQSIIRSEQLTKLQPSSSSTFLPSGHTLQETGSGKMSGEPPAKSQITPVHEMITPVIQPLTTITTTNQPQKHPIIDVVKVTPQNHQSLKIHNLQESPQQLISQNMNLNSRVGPMDSRIAELANQIRLHRHPVHAQHNQQNESLPGPQTDRHSFPMPPVVRHKQRGQSLTNSQQNSLYAHSRQHNDLQQQRQQILQMNKAPTPQQLRAILAKLAATNRLNSRPTTITSGAASLPQGIVKDSNYVGASGINNMYPPSAFSSDQSPPAQQMTNTNEHYSQFPGFTSGNSLPSSPWSNTAPNGALGSSNIPGSFIPQPYWPQHLQQQQYMQNEVNQQGIQRQQQQFLHQEPTFLPPPIVRNGYPDNYARSGPGISEYQPNGLPGPNPQSADNSMQYVFLNNIQHPVRIRRPVFEQLSNWHQRQYETPQLPYYV